MLLLLQLAVIVLSFIAHEHEAIAAYVPPHTTEVYSVHKHTDAAKPLYSVQITTTNGNMQSVQENFVIDIDAPFIWHDCIVQWKIYPGSCLDNKFCTSPVSCEDYECTDVRTSYTYEKPYCPPPNNESTLPGWGFCTCPVNVVDPVTGSCGQAMLNYDYAYPNAACAPSSSFQSFPKNVTGVMALSTSRYALPAYLFEPHKKVIGLCLPSTLSTPGVLFTGDGPYYLLPESDIDVRSYLSYTPLISHPGSFGYFIGVNNIVIKKRSISIPANATTKISTIDPYTILRTDIYNLVIRRFSKVTKCIPPAMPVPPFGLCFSTQAGVRVPDIDFMLPQGNKWIMSTANSIKQIAIDVACLALVDGGATSEPAIVIGTFQMEDNFIVFDLDNSTFGFSSSLLRKRTSCSNFNYTLSN